MDFTLQEKVADTTTSSEAHHGLEHFGAVRRLRKLSDQPRIEIQQEPRSRQQSPLRWSPKQKQQEKHQAQLSLNFESEFTLINDGNSFYRLVGIQHLRHALHRPQALQELHRAIARKQFDLKRLRNVPKSLEAVLDKRELSQMFRNIIDDLSHLGSSLFAESLINLMQQDKKVDFAVVATYRLYTYIVGYQSIQGDPIGILLKGDEEQAILTYGCEVTHMVIKLIAQSLSTSINLYILFEGDMQYLRFGLDFSESHNFELWVKLVESHYSLLVPKQRSPLKLLPTRESAEQTPEPQKPRQLSENLLKGLAVDQENLQQAGLTADFFQQIYERMSEAERRATVMECLRQHLPSLRE